MSDEQIVALLGYRELALRPGQILPPDNWRSYGFLTGRGWGKTHGIATEIHRRVQAGEIHAPALIAPTIKRVAEIQVNALLDTASPWCQCEAYQGGVKWENGVVAEATTSELERPSSGSNYDFVWCTELVRWNPSTRRKALDDITTACRLGPRPQYVWDTTSSGKNELIQWLLDRHSQSPTTHRLVRGTLFENPILSGQYVRDEIKKYQPGTRRYDEEVLGMSFQEEAGALWEQAWITNNRVADWPLARGVCVLGLDPALSGDPTADEVGIAKALRLGQDIYLTDLSGKMPPEDYASIIVRECQRDAAGVVVERNHVGQHARDLIRVHAKLAGMRVELLPDPKKPFPARRPGTIYMREIVTHTSKETRAAPAAALYKAGIVHHAGELARLEHEQTTWEPGTRRSPNRLDAAVFAVSELGEVSRPARPDVRRDIRTANSVAKNMRSTKRAVRGKGLGL
jgi:phage terminase large subunit-like protein